MIEHDENGVPRTSGNERSNPDLFSGEQQIAPPPAKEQAEEVIFPPAGNGPVLTNNTPQPGKSPLVFSDNNPLPHRSGEPETGTMQENSKPLPKIRRAVHLDAGSFPAGTGFGDMLKYAREQVGLDLDQVEKATKLRPYYLQALERSNLKKLPPMVYVNAYVKTLCALYGLDEDSIALIRSRVNPESDPEKNDVPQTLIQNLEKDGLINEEENERIRHIFWAAAAGIALIAIVLIWVIVSALSGPSAQETGKKNADKTEKNQPVPESLSPSGKPEFKQEDFDELSVPQILEPSTLQMSKKPALMQ